MIWWSFHNQARSWLELERDNIPQPQAHSWSRIWNQEGCRRKSWLLSCRREGNFHLAIECRSLLISKKCTVNPPEKARVHVTWPAPGPLTLPCTHRSNMWQCIYTTTYQLLTFRVAPGLQIILACIELLVVIKFGNLASGTSELNFGSMVWYRHKFMWEC